MIIEALLSASIAVASPQDPPDRWFAEDKLKHFVTSFVASSIAASGVRAAGLDRRHSIVVGATFGTVAGLLKEVHDKRAGQHFSGRDLVWDLGGVGAAVALLDRSR